MSPGNATRIVLLELGKDRVALPQKANRRPLVGRRIDEKVVKAIGVVAVRDHLCRVADGGTHVEAYEYWVDEVDALRIGGIDETADIASGGARIRRGRHADAGVLYPRPDGNTIGPIDAMDVGVARADGTVPGRQIGGHGGLLASPAEIADALPEDVPSVAAGKGNIAVNTKGGDGRYDWRITCRSTDGGGESL